MKFKFKVGNYNKGPQSEGFIKKPFLFAVSFFRNLKKSYLLMSKRERILAVALLIAAFSLLGFKFYQGYLQKTVAAPNYGGEYSEALVGDAKFLNPVTAQNDTEKTVAKLLFRGLVKVEDQKTVLPDVAESYTVSEDGLRYTFNLRKNVNFSDGQPLTANDVAFTIDSIKTPELKSPLYASWSSVEVNVIDEYTIEFGLTTAYGPFIYNCDFGIIPAHLSSDEFSKKLIGNGPFKFSKSIKDEKRINEIDLVRNDSFYGERPYLESIKFYLFENQSEAKEFFENNENISGLFGATAIAGKEQNFASSRSLALVLNLRNNSLKDKELRSQILTGEKIAQNIPLKLTTLDTQLQRAKADELKTRLESQGLTITIDYQNGIGIQERLAKKDYELLLYGFDFGYDRDPYLYWHSSQMDLMNLSGWSDKNSDIAMEDARMLPDVAARNAKYDEIFAALKNEYLAEFFEPKMFDFRIREKIKGVAAIIGNQPFSRFNDIEKWYIKEKRVKK